MTFETSKTFEVTNVQIHFIRVYYSRKEERILEIIKFLL